MTSKSWQEKICRSQQSTGLARGLDSGGEATYGMLETAKNGQSQTKLPAMQASMVLVVDCAHALTMSHVTSHSQSMDGKLDPFAPWMYHHQA